MGSNYLSLSPVTTPQLCGSEDPEKYDASNPPCDSDVAGPPATLNNAGELHPTTQTRNSPLTLMKPHPPLSVLWISLEEDSSHISCLPLNSK